MNPSIGVVKRGVEDAMMQTATFKSNPPMEKRATKKKWRRVNANPSDDNESQGSFVRLDDFSEGYSCGNYESVMLKERLGCCKA